MELISREEVEKLADDLHWLHYEDEITKQDIIDGLRKILTIESRAKGKWIDKDEKEEIYSSLWKCSNCGAVEIAGEPPNYCPNCGADMRGEE